MRWAEITISCDPVSAEAVSYALHDIGCGGAAIKPGVPLHIQGGLPVNDELVERLDTLTLHLNRLPEFGLPALLDKITLRYVEEEDWAQAWKKYFKPLKPGNRIVIKPSWEDYSPAIGESVIELDPGMAFGTGGHPTTRLCMIALEKFVLPGMIVADIGTGSGILSLTAARLGASKALATDIDSLPRKIARENVIRNDLQDVISILEMNEFEEMAVSCDIIVANIIANTIIELAPQIHARCKLGSLFIASGIVEEHESLVKAVLQSLGFDEVETLREDIWVCLIVKCSSKPMNMHAYKQLAESLPPIGSL